MGSLQLDGDFRAMLRQSSDFGGMVAALSYIDFIGEPPFNFIKLDDETTVSYLPANRIPECETRQNTWESSQRQTMRLGRMLRRLGEYVKTADYHRGYHVEQYQIGKIGEATDRDIQTVTDRIAALMTPPTFRVVSGDDIVYWYLSDHYTREGHTGNLYSCMSGYSSQRLIERYADEPNCRLAIGTNADEQLVCRCLVWSATDGKTYFDKRYGSQRASSLLVRWCEGQGWIDGCYGYERGVNFTVACKQNWDRLRTRPYLDTMSPDRDGNLTCGVYGGAGFGGTECAICEDVGDEDEMYHTNDGMLCPDCHDRGYCTLCYDYIGADRVTYVDGVGQICTEHTEYFCADCGTTLDRGERDYGYCESCEADHRCPVCHDWIDDNEPCADCVRDRTCVVCGVVSMECDANERLYGVVRCDICQAECEEEEGS